jgi:hypothetical protein
MVGPEVKRLIGYCPIHLLPHPATSLTTLLRYAQMCNLAKHHKAVRLGAEALKESCNSKNESPDTSWLEPTLVDCDAVKTIAKATERCAPRPGPHRTRHTSTQPTLSLSPCVSPCLRGDPTTGLAVGGVTQQQLPADFVHAA